MAKRHLDNLNLMLNLSQAGIGTPKTATVDPKDYQEKTLTGEVTAEIETSHALIYAYDGVEIPDFLADNFDRIFQMILDYLNLKDKDDKIVVWVMDLETLRHIPHELLHYFVDEYEKEVAAGLPDEIKRKYVTHVLAPNFLKQKEEEIVTEISEIIVRKRLASPILGPFEKAPLSTTP